MNRTGFVAVLGACIGLSSACSMQKSSTQEIGLERDGRDHIESIRQHYEVNPGGTLTVNAELGAIHIRSSNTNKADVLVRKRFRATDTDLVRKAFSNIDVKIDQTYSGIRIEVDRIRNIPSKRWFWQDWPDRVSVEIEVLVPVEFNLDLSTVGDDIQTENIEGNVTAKTLSGDITTGPTEGDLSIATVSGNIETSRVVGKVRTITLSGHIEIGPVDGDATVRSNSGRIETGTVEGDLHAKSLTGHIKIGPVDSDATVRSNSGNIETGTVEGDLYAKSLTGRIKIGPVNGDATLGTNSGKIETDTVAGDLHAKSLSGNIETGPVDGDATVSSTAGDIKTGYVHGKLKTTTLVGNITNR